MSKVSMRRTLRQVIRDVLFRTPRGTYLFYKIRILREKLALARYSDLQYIEREYLLRYGRQIQLCEPLRLSEKLQWLKLFYRDPDIPICTDKFTVREYLTEKGFGHLLTDIVGVYHDSSEIVFDDLPNKFAAKATHGSSWNWICLDKESSDWATYKRIMNSWLKLNLFVFGREWNYKDLVPKILIEKYMEMDVLIDYKFWCCNGSIQCIQINFNHQGQRFVDFYTTNWDKLPFTYNDEVGSDLLIEKPGLLDEMVMIAKKLSEPFPFVRVDLYDLGDIVKFGELTFFPGGGMTPFTEGPEDYDILMGGNLQLPPMNWNTGMYNELGCQ